MVTFALAWSLREFTTVRAFGRLRMHRVSIVAIVLAGLLTISTVLPAYRSPSTFQEREDSSLAKFDGRPWAASQDLPMIETNGLSDEMPRPVKRFNLKPRAAEVTLFSFEFLRPYLGREGPNFTELDGEPSAGAQYLANAELSRQEAVSTAKFELVDEGGNVIQLLHFLKQDNSLERGRFVGSVKIPGQAFRVAVSGMGVDGEPYRNVYEHLFHPTTRPPAPPLLPDLTLDEAKKITAWLTEMEKQAVAESEKRASKYPDGLFVMPRVEISNMTYQSFVSQKGNKLGMQLSYDMRFSVDGDYAHSLQVFPNYQDYNRRSLVDMDVLSEQINPQPEPPSYATPDIYVDMKTLVKYGSEAWYKGGVVYHFKINLVPDFVGQNANKTKFCVDEKHYESKVTSFADMAKDEGGLVPRRISDLPFWNVRWWGYRTVRAAEDIL